MSSIYKITNIITNKIYIGYTSRTIKRRFYEHKWEAFNSDVDENASCLYQSMRKYGTNAFVIDEIIQFDENEYDWKELEKYYIKEYNSLTPNGYNILLGGNKPPVHYGESNIKTKICDADLQLLINDLKDSNLSYADIARKYNISVSHVYNLNLGKSRKQPNITYPIRKYTPQEKLALQVINILAVDTTLSNSKIADLIPNYFRANEIASINNGNKFSYLWTGDFPIRKIIVPNDYDEKQQKAYNILLYIQNNQNKKITQKQIQQDLGYSRRVVENTLKGIYPYNIANQNYPIILNK